MKARHFVFPILLGCVLAHLTCLTWGVTGTFTKSTATWNGLPRLYALYVPANLPANSPLVVVLHPTSKDTNPPSSPPYFRVFPWETLADSNGFAVLWPLSTFNTRSSQWYWDAFFMDYSFPIYPDDAGYIRSLILTFSAQLQTDMSRIFVAGMSSGGFMTHKVGATSADLIAAIGPVSGMVDVEQASASLSLPSSTSPVSVIELHGDIDTTVPYCGGKRNYWQESNLLVPSLDTTSSYWRAQNACSDVVPQLCTNGSPTAGVNGLDAFSCAPGIEVEVIREVGVGHIWVNGTEQVLWNFFAGHPKILAPGK